MAKGKEDALVSKSLVPGEAAVFNKKRISVQVEKTPEQKKQKKQKFEITPDLSEIKLEDPNALVKPKKHKKQNNQKKESDQDEMTALKKNIDDLRNFLSEMTEIFKKLKKNSDGLETSLKEKETPKKNVVEHECLFESKDSGMKNWGTIFVQGFNCAFSIDDIKSALKKHFSSCGEIFSIHVPFECKTGSPLGFAFINLIDEKKALALNGSFLGGLRLEVTMAKERGKCYGYTNFAGCERCRRAKMKPRMERFYDRGFSQDFLIEHGLVKTVPSKIKQ